MPQILILSFKPNSWLAYSVRLCKLIIAININQDRSMPKISKLDRKFCALDVPAWRSLCATINYRNAIHLKKTKVNENTALLCLAAQHEQPRTN